MNAWFSIIKAMFVRLLLIFHVILCTWRVTVDLRSEVFWLLVIILLPLCCESAYTIIKRQGVEFSRFTPCLLFYLGAVLPSIWFLELDRTDKFLEQTGNVNSTNSNISSSNNNNNSQNPDTWQIVVEQMMPYVIFVSRWILPRGKVTREELAEILFAFVEIAADIMEFLSLLDEDVIRGDKALACCVLSIWTLSVLQFTMTIITTQHRKSEQNAPGTSFQTSKEKKWEKTKQEILAIFMTMFMQDVPFAIMRLYTIIRFSRVDYSLIFFTSKNLLIIVLLLYKVATLCRKHHCPDPTEENDDAVVMHERRL